MPKYALSARNFVTAKAGSLESKTIEVLWDLFVAICDHWENISEPEPMKTRFLGFLENRTERDLNYLTYYRDAASVIEELILKEGRERAFLILLANEVPQSEPDSRLEVARERAAREFITLQISLGGFKDFTKATNYPGYISGVNGKGPAPYRTFSRP